MGKGQKLTTFEYFGISGHPTIALTNELDRQLSCTIVVQLYFTKTSINTIFYLSTENLVETFCRIMHLKLFCDRSIDRPTLQPKELLLHLRDYPILL